MIFNVVLGKNMFRDQRLLSFWFLDIKNFRDPPHSNKLEKILFVSGHTTHKVLVLDENLLPVSFIFSDTQWHILFTTWIKLYKFCYSQNIRVERGKLISCNGLLCEGFIISYFTFQE
jgi:hypothetical protein